MIKNLKFFVGVVAICNVENEVSELPQNKKEIVLLAVKVKLSAVFTAGDVFFEIEF